jgi:zinc transport system ATP-binding protein
MIEVKNAVYVIGSKKIIDNVSVNFLENSLTTIIGPNGAGKSTLLLLILKQISPTSGNIIWKSNANFGYMPQKLKISNRLNITAHEFLKIHPLYSKDILSNVLEKLFIDSRLLSTSMHNISGGETQKILLAFAMIGNPKVLVLDEPDQGIDVFAQEDMFRILGEIKQDHIIIMVSHNLHYVSKESDYVLCLHGHVCCSGYPDNLINNHGFIQYHHHHNHSHVMLKRA